MLDKFKDNKITFIVMTVLSAVVQAVSFSSFSVPGDIYPGGISGLARLAADLLYDFKGISIPYTAFYFVINVLMAVLVFKYIGRWFAVLSLLQTSLVSVLATFMPPIFKMDSVLLLAVFGGIVDGIGSGLALSHNASTGGTDFITIYFSNKYNKSIWNYTFIFNCMILFAAGFVYGWERACYSIIFQYCGTAMVKKMHKRYTHETLTIITNHPEDVSKAVMHRVKHAMTSIDATGVYANEPRTILYVVVNSFETKDVVNTVMLADPNAFVNIQNTVDVKGRFFQKPLE